MLERVWTNSTFGRAVGSVFGAVMVAAPFIIDPDNGDPRWHGWNAVAGVALMVVGLATLIGVWTSRLVLAGDTLTAVNFFVARSLPLVEVAEVQPAAMPFFGIKISKPDGTEIRTLVSGQSWDELWTPRATKIAEELLAMAESARSIGG